MTTHIREIAGIGHDEAIEVAATVNGALIKQLRDLDAADWNHPTDCDRWTVKDITAHLLGWAEFFTVGSEFRRQTRAAFARRRELGNIVDAQNQVQVDDRSQLSPEELVGRLEDRLPRFVAFRRRFGGVGRGVPFVAPLVGRATVGFLLDIIYSRDVFMHRIDIARATDREFQTSSVDRRLLDDIVRHWARRSRADARVELSGPLARTYIAGTGSEATIRGDAIELCRLFAGRAELDSMTLEGNADQARRWLAVGAPF